MELRQRATAFVAGLPVAHRVGIVAAAAVVGMLGVLFVGWLTTPSYTVLYADLASEDVAGTIDELEGLGVPYQLGAGGATVLVPRDALYSTRAALAEAGIAGRAQPRGYELLDDQGLSISDFRQRVDYQRALEGELVRTVTAMHAVDDAQVHIVLPDDSVFTDTQEPSQASVLLTTSRTLTASEVESIVFLVSSSVEGLEPKAITVADASGTVLHAPGDVGGAAQMANRQLRQTREFEQALASDITVLLQEATGSPASAVVNATLNFDETETETETYDPDSKTTLRETTVEESFEGTGGVPGGAVGVDGGPLPADAEDSSYERTEATREFGVNRVTTTTTRAPGEVEQLSVAIVADSVGEGAAALETPEIEELVAAAVGLDSERGDTIAVTRLPLSVEEEPAPPASPMWLESLPQIIGVLVLLLVAVGLFLMTRQRGSTEIVATPRAPARAEPQPATVRVTDDHDYALTGSDSSQIPAASSPLRDEVTDLVRSQPDEIATLLRGWLADRRSL